MSLSQTGDFNLSLTTGGSTEETISALVETVKQQQATIESLTDELEDVRDELEDVRDELGDERAERTKDVAEDRKRLTDVETRLEDIEDGGSGDETPTPDADRNGSTMPETPLERVCALDDGTAERELTANQSRARFIARDVTDYAEKVPAGYAIRSGDLGRVLRAGTECRGRTQTVARVMDFLDDLGGDDVDVVERRGTKRVVFTERAAHRLEQLGASSPSDATNHGVVMSGSV